MDSNKKVIRDAFKDFQQQIDKEVTDQLSLICRNILTKAIRARLSSGGHDYTGNLLNSIVVALYDKGNLKNAWSSGEDGMIRRPIARKMTVRKKPYVFAIDYSGAKSRYTATVDTNRGYADEDVEDFLIAYQPAFTNGYCIAVAYTVEYAQWVEAERQTTGFLESQKYAGQQVRLSFLPLKAA